MRRIMKPRLAHQGVTRAYLSGPHDENRSFGPERVQRHLCREPGPAQYSAAPQKSVLQPLVICGRVGRQLLAVFYVAARNEGRWLVAGGQPDGGLGPARDRGRCAPTGVMHHRVERPLRLSRLGQGPSLVEGREVANYHRRRTGDSLLGIACSLVAASVEHDPVAAIDED
jgi:hypothetical protein